MESRWGADGMEVFLADNRDALVDHCRAKIARHPQRHASGQQLADGVPLFLERLQHALRSEHRATGCGTRATAMAAHGRRLLEFGYSVDDVVNDYGDLCQAITDLAVERDAPFSVDAYGTLHRCIENAIASAIAEFAAWFDEAASHALIDVRQAAPPADGAEMFSLARFIDEAVGVAALRAREIGRDLWVPTVDARIRLFGNRSRLLDALVNLLQDAFECTAPNTEVTLAAREAYGRVLIDVRDHGAELPAGVAEQLFAAFRQVEDDRHRPGLANARRCVEDNGGTLTIRRVPELGCVFTIDLPLRPHPGDP